ncbi:hypothetical protein [Deinococcus misasensis]|uniref:hypothetical protein n=1 Tax=Deinococcus misasensis TaxID=392413 RepID=UPI00054D3C52|nr:hypothetical protein [Deinococcus misasensis]
MARFRNVEQLERDTLRRFSSFKEKSIRGGGILTFNTAKRVLSDGADRGRGKLYPRRNRSGGVKRSRKKGSMGRVEKYRASAPWQPIPARNSGGLISGMRLTITKTEAKIWSAVPYYKFLIKGTPRMKARNFMKVAARKVRPEIDALFRLLMEKESR